ncbi:MAG: hypothetical protein WEC84_04895 [Candidatus Andersenbacteria bacterium]
MKTPFGGSFLVIVGVFLLALGYLDSLHLTAGLLRGEESPVTEVIARAGQRITFSLLGLGLLLAGCTRAITSRLEELAKRNS